MRRQIPLGAVLFFSAHGLAWAQSPPPVAPVPLTFDQRFHIYLKQTYSVSSILVPAVFSGIDQAESFPREWGQGGVAYGERLATVHGQFQINNACVFAVGALLHEDSRYVPSGLPKTWPRMQYVLVHTLVARTDSGGHQPAFATFAGAFGFGFFPNLWLPPSENSPGQGLTRSLTFIGVNVGMNMGLEFHQDDLRFLRRIFHRGTAVSSSSTPSATGAGGSNQCNDTLYNTKD